MPQVKKKKLTTRSSQSINSVMGNRRGDFLSTGKAMARLTSIDFNYRQDSFAFLLKLDDLCYLHT